MRTSSDGLLLMNLWGLLGAASPGSPAGICGSAFAAERSINAGVFLLTSRREEAFRTVTLN